VLMSRVAQLSGLRDGGVVRLRAEPARLDPAGAALRGADGAADRRTGAADHALGGPAAGGEQAALPPARRRQPGGARPLHRVVGRATGVLRRVGRPAGRHRAQPVRQPPQPGPRRGDRRPRGRDRGQGRTATATWWLLNGRRYEGKPGHLQYRMLEFEALRDPPRHPAGRAAGRAETRAPSRPGSCCASPRRFTAANCCGASACRWWRCCWH